MPLFDQQEKTTAGIIVCIISLFAFSVVYAQRQFNVHTPQRLEPGNSQAPGIDSLTATSYRVFAVAEKQWLLPSVIDIPAGSEIDFYITAKDIAEEFEIAGKHINMTAAKDLIYKTSVKFDTPGVYKIRRRNNSNNDNPYTGAEIIVHPQQ